MIRQIGFSILLLMGLLMGLGASVAAGDMAQKLQQRITIKMANTDVKDILQMISHQYQLNLVVGGAVSGQLSLQLTDVPLSDALTAILKPIGAHYIVEGNFILVKPYQLRVPGELQTRVFRLDYVDAFRIRPTLLPLLSDRGKIEALISEPEKDETQRRSDMVIITDYQENIDRIAAVIDELDVPGQQLQIEVRLIETILGGERQLGLRLPNQITVKSTGAENTLPYENAATGQTTQNPLSLWYDLPDRTGQLNWGILTVDQLQATLSLLAKDNRSRLVSNPRVTTLNNHKAVIKIGTIVPIPEVSRGISGDLISYREKEVNMYLEVIPRINTDGQITLRVHPVLEEIIGYTGPSDFPQPITSKREVETTITVQDSQTIVIGGLIKENTTEVIDKVWLLGDIPLLGALFRHKTQRKEQSDLLIFITPRIIQKP
ncbi:MAG: hypothetical protein GXO78_13035 [Calditrichaeota bacterium]|nr:hypothetical protein [Calditrichota bacterium]